ncbi:MAG TPA: Type 1 glutamine amidotransferase-like domain-containing protein [Acholeplasma sp.]|jgi:hypothetical protein
MINILSSHSIFSHESVKHEVSKYVHKGKKVCVIAFSFFDSGFTQESYELSYQKEGRWYLHIIEPLMNLGILEEDIDWIIYHKDTKDEAIKKLKKADIIFLPGGAPDLFIKRLIELDILDTLKSLDKIIMGPSAGTMIQFDTFHISKDHDYKKFSIHEGLGFIKDFGVEVHFRRRRQQKKAIRKMSHLNPRPIYVIEEPGMMILENNKVVYSTHVRKYYEKGHKIK